MCQPSQTPLPIASLYKAIDEHVLVIMSNLQSGTAMYQTRQMLPSVGSPYTIVEERPHANSLVSDYIVTTVHKSKQIYCISG